MYTLEVYTTKDSQMGGMRCKLHIFKGSCKGFTDTYERRSIELLKKHEI